MPRKTTRKLVLVPAAVFALGLAAPAGAGDVATYDTELKMRDTFPAFHGRVKSDADVCVKGRKVKLYRKKRNGDNKLLGVDLADSRGKWAITEPDEFTLRSGAYFSKTPRIIVDNMGLPTICTRARSQTEVVD